MASANIRRRNQKENNNGHTAIAMGDEKKNRNQNGIHPHISHRIRFAKKRAKRAKKNENVNEEEKVKKKSALFHQLHQMNRCKWRKCIPT